MTNEINFNSADLKKITRMSGKVTVISTVCPDYPHNGTSYTFFGELGSEVSLTAREHLFAVPELMNMLTSAGCEPSWLVLVADLPELTEGQREFWSRMAGSKEEYIARCAKSVQAIEHLGVKAQTFSSFYAEHGLNYLAIQESVAKRILEEAENNPSFASKFFAFMLQRKVLAEKFRGRTLSEPELCQAAAHGMSLYVTHGTLLRKIFLGQNLIVVNHQTTNLQNFFLCKFVSGCENLIDTPKFPLGVLKKELY